MGKIFIMSDSHGLTEEVAMIKNRHSEEADAIIHCGDSELSPNSGEMKGMLCVRGNCDFEPEYPNDLLEEAGSRKIYITHGHLYNVKSTLMNLHYRAKEVGAQIVCFGHSHIAGAELIDSILYINPGSVRLPKMRTEKTYASIELVGADAHVTFYDLEGSVLESLSHTFHLEHPEKN